MIITMAGEDFEVFYVQSLIPVQAELKNEPFITFDTETTGLHIKKDVPFLGGICVGHKAFIFPASRENFMVLRLWASQVKRVYGHNVSYDMHMLANFMGDNGFPLTIKNFGDTMALCRLVFQSVSARDGGDKLGLKDVSVKYIDKTANRYEHAVKQWLQAKERADKKLLTAILHGVKDEDGRPYSVKRLEQELEEQAFVYTPALDAYKAWRKEYPIPNYSHVPLEIMIPYLASDVILTRLLALKCLPIIVFHEQTVTMEREFKVLPVVYKMESNGVAVDLPYLEESSKKLDDYIDEQYTKLHMATGLQFTVYQNKVIAKIFTDLLGKVPSSTDKKFLGKVIAKGGTPGEIAEYINRIRRLEKWKSVYVDRLIDNVVKAGDGRAYTQMSQFNPVSGRFSGDFQQMPKDAIYTDEGYDWEKENKGHKVPKEYVLFHPRAAFKPTGNNLKYMFFLDFSQVELRVQAHYTVPFGGDVNMCRAYCPYKCVHYLTGEKYDFSTYESRQRWSEKQPTGDSAWLDEDKKPWQKTDVHMATTLKALVAMGYKPEEMSKDDLAWWRKKGKTFNFGRNYGMGDAHAAETLDIELSQAKAMNQGYTDAFPLVVTYQNHVAKAVQTRGYVTNLLGRRYYLSDWNKAYKAANYLVQGSCADDLKEKMVKIDQFLVKNNCQTRILLCIHDELIFEVPENEVWVIPKIKEIMEKTDHVLIPIVAEVEYTSTTWADKEEWEMKN